MTAIPEAFSIALRHHQAGRLSEAEAIYRQILAADSGHAEAWHLLGVAAVQTGRFPIAIECIQRALAQRPDWAEALGNLGNAWQAQGKLDEATACYERALQLKPDFTDALNNLGNVWKAQGKLDGAVACYERALQLKPDYAEALANLGNAWQALGKLDEAVDCLQRALQLKSDFAEAYNNLGNVRLAQGLLDDAAACYLRALELRPTYAQAHNNLGYTRQTQRRPNEAVACYVRALQLAPNDAIANFNLGNALQDQEKLDEAIVCYRRALELRHDDQATLVALVHAMQHACCWDDLEALAQRVIDGVSRETECGMSAVSPFSFLALPTPTTAAQQLSCARQWAERQLRANGRSGRLPPRSAAVDRNSRITIGYLSADFRSHPLAFSMVELFEQHNRDRFTVNGYSYGADDHSPIRQRLSRAFDRFVDLHGTAHAESAQMIADDGVDILIDLTGYTRNARTQIVAQRPAPVQVSYWGYPGTMGAPFLDYILVDDFIVPADQQPFFTEKLVHLPGCYLPNDGHREIASRSPSRAECGLPKAGFVFCCFNNSYKITPAVFDVWMALLKDVPESVLWLLEGNRFVAPSLRKAAQSRGIAAERLVFAPRLPLPEHLARHRLADLFLDNFPVNAHATASDALWAGCPVLTIAGDTFVSRVAGSLLHSLGLPELITTSLEKYHEMALHLARSPRQLAEFRERLQANSKTSPVFDGVQLARNLESAYRTMWQIHDSGEQPRTFEVSPTGDTLPSTSISEATARALEHHQAGRLSEAESIYRQILAADPLQADAWHLLGVVAHQTGQHQSAVERIQRALQINPDFAAALNNLGRVWQALENHAEAVVCLQRAVDLQPDYAEAHNNLGNSRRAQGRLDDAVACFQRAVRLKPDHAETHNNLGIVRKEQRNLDAAVVCYQRALELKPDFAEALSNLGDALLEQGQRDEAVACLERALKLKPDCVEAHHNLGNARLAQGNLDEAVACYQRALAYKPDFVEAYGNLAHVWQAQGKLHDAVACCQRALQLKPGLAQVHSNLAFAWQALGELDKAVACYQRALELKPEFAEAHNNLGNLWKDQGKLEAAVASYQRALKLNPDYVQAHDNLLYSIQYRPGVTLSELATAHAEYDRRHAAPLRSAWRPHENDRDPDRRLRLGFVSPDFGRHPVGFFLIRALENLGSNQWDTVCYSDRHVKDELTLRFQACATSWRDVKGQTDQELSERIHADRIDILFDLAGHTAHNRLQVFARKPAPIQITWIGYEGTTGLAAMDYLLADRHVVPPGCESFYQERVLRMPDGYLCYDPPDAAPAVGPLPAWQTGFATFGSFNNLAKITPELVAVWSQILRSAPATRLVMKYRGLGDATVKRRYLELFAANGVEAQRLELLPPSSYADYLATYERVDLLLDPFPFSGSTTTCEALWMGVPVITCPGETFASRHSLDHLANVGLTETIARDLNEYSELAVALASDLPRLAGLRAGLRERVAASPLCDGRHFAANLETVLRGVWRAWATT